MTSLDRMQDLLPLPYSVAGDALLTAVLNVCALEVEALEEEVDRMRRSHWLDQAWRSSDVDRLAALLGIRRFPAEPTPLFRARLVALVRARLRGAVGPLEIRRFVYEYLRGVEDVLDFTVVAGLRGLKVEEAFEGVEKRPRFRRLRLVENPPRVRRSRVLRDRGGRVTQLFRWTERNAGLSVAPITLRISGAKGGTSMPAIANLTTRELIGWRGRLRFGQTLIIETVDGAARATTGGVDVTDQLFAIKPFVLGTPAADQPIDRQNIAVPSMARGDNDLLFAAIGLWDERAFDRVFFFPDDPLMREAVFGETAFDHALFPAGTLAHLDLTWTEEEPASFEVHVPLTVVIEPRALADEFRRASLTRPPWAEVADDLAETLPQLRAAGVRAALHFDSFHDTQEQIVSAQPSWIAFDPETASAGQGDTISIGARFDETVLERSRFN
jgi:hypothetical protein